ncbi:MAG TPA: hypothetical protein VKV95_04075 [Terriglobia bacterium]|nr:hypothetical protein [Terriglobia bacterium]
MGNTPRQAKSEQEIEVTTNEGTAAVASEELEVCLQPESITLEMDRYNSRIFFFSCILTFCAASVLYVGVIQAALCDRLGASAAVANFPASAYTLVFFFPAILASLIPCRLERTTAIVSSYATATVAAITAIVLIFPFSSTTRIVVVVASGLLTGVSESTAGVYRLQCLSRGTTAEGRARTLRLAYTVGPVFAILGSIGAQFVLNRPIRGIVNLQNFGLIYLVSMFCIIGVAFLCSHYKLIPVQEDDRPSFYQHVVEGIKSYAGNRSLVILWFAYILFNFSLLSLCNLTLYSRNITGWPPQHFAGVIMALRFAFKALGGFALGALASLRGTRAPLVVATLLNGLAIFWGWMIPGYLFFVAFGLIGAGELGGVYFNNYALSVSSVQRGARNLAFLNLAVALAGLAPVAYGVIADEFGFPMSFLLGIGTGIFALWLLSSLPSGKGQKPSTDPGKIVVRRGFVD